MRAVIIWSVLSLGIHFHVISQILNDSTQNIYGPKTTEFTYFSNIKFNRSNYLHPDTTLTGFQIYSFKNKHENKIQNLGNIGTAAQNIYYLPPDMIGRNSGFHAYDLYFIPIDQIQLFNTRSPYTNINPIFGGGNRNITLIQHSQSIKPNWNFGANYRKIIMNKQISSTGRADNEVESTAYNGYMYYWTKDSTYFVLGAFSRLNHEVAESGGIDHSGFNSLDEYFNDNVNVNLENASSSEWRIQYEFYQQYSPAHFFTVYNEFRYGLKSDYFTDDKLGQEGSFFDHILFNESETYYKSKFRDLSNEAGIKGDLKKAFFNAYFRYRQTGMVQRQLPAIDIRHETYLGGNLRYDNDSTYCLLVSGEIMNNGNHLLRGEYENKLWDLSYTRIMYEPGVIQEDYFSNHYEWHNDFGSVQSDVIRGVFKIPLRWISIRPNMTVSNVKNYIYYDSDRVPAQTGDFVQIYSPGLDFSINFARYFYWNSSFSYTLKTGSEESRSAFRFPSVFANSSLYFTKHLFEKKLLFLMGTDTHYQNSYFADGYNPVTQQFYLQNDFAIPGYFLMDLYLNIKIKTVRIFLKMTYLNQAKNQGYFASPYYIGQSKVFDLGLSWMFYD